MKSDKKKITLFIAEDIWRRAKVKLANGEAKSFQEVLAGLLSEWVGTGKRCDHRCQ